MIIERLAQLAETTVPLRMIVGSVPDRWEPVRVWSRTAREYVVPEIVNPFQNGFELNRGVTNVPLSYAQAISEATGVSVDDLVRYDLSVNASALNGEGRRKQPYLPIGQIHIRAISIAETERVPAMTYFAVWAGEPKEMENDKANPQKARARADELQGRGLLFDRTNVYVAEKAGTYLPGDPADAGIVVQVFEELTPEITLNGGMDARIKRIFTGALMRGKEYAGRLSEAAMAEGIDIPAEAFLTTRGIPAEAFAYRHFAGRMPENPRLTDILQPHAYEFRVIPDGVAIVPSRQIMEAHSHN